MSSSKNTDRGYQTQDAIDTASDNYVAHPEWKLSAIAAIDQYLIFNDSVKSNPTREPYRLEQAKHPPPR